MSSGKRPVGSLNAPAAHWLPSNWAANDGRFSIFGLRRILPQSMIDAP